MGRQRRVGGAALVSKRLLGIVLGIGGILVVIAVVRDVGAQALLDVLVLGAPWLPWLIALEVGAAALDALAIRVLHGERTEGAVHARAALLATLSVHTLPGGRMLGEVLRASSIASGSGAGPEAFVRSGAIALVGHGLHVLCVAVMASVAALAVDGPLRWALALVAAWTLVLGTALVAAPRSLRLLRWLASRTGLTKLADVVVLERIDGAPRALALSALSRLVHLIAAGVAVQAVLAAPSVIDGAIVGEALQLLAANVGDAVPGQAGVIEGTFRSLAGSLYPSTHPEVAARAAVAVALLLRASRIVVAAASGLLYVLLGALPQRLPRALARPAVLLGLLALMPSPSAAQTHVVVHQRMVGLVNPVGAEHAISLGVRVDHDDGVDPLREGTHLELGGVAYVSPISQLSGGYVQVSPWAFLVLRAELLSLTQWPIGMDGAGYYAVEGNDRLVGGLSADDGAVAAGFDLQLSATLQLAVQIDAVRPIFLAQLMLEHETLGDAPFHYDPRYDLVLARQDWMLAASSYALLEIAASPQVALRFGAFDDLRFVPRSGYANHVLGPVAMLALTELDPAVPEILVLIRAGEHLDASRREGEWTGLLAVLCTYELGAVDRGADPSAVDPARPPRARAGDRDEGRAGSRTPGPS